MERLRAHLRSLDLRFEDRGEEANFKADLEPELLRWMLIGCAITVVCTTVYGVLNFGPLLLTDQLVLDIADAKSRVFFCQQMLWTLVPAILAGLVYLRVGRGWFHSWNWESVITGVVAYGASVRVLGQTYYLTILLDHDPSLVWSVGVSCSHEAWVMLGLQTMTMAAAFFLPIRSIVSWLVGFIGLLTYSLAHCLVDGKPPDTELAMRTVILAALICLAWNGSMRIEKHLREKWWAVQQVQRSRCTIEEQKVSIQIKGREVLAKEAELKETCEMARSLQTVTRALCDTMIHLNGELRISLTEESHDIFFEQHVEGQLFTDLLTAGDQKRFLACVARASESRIPECIPVTLHRKYTISEVHLLLVDRGNAALRYLVGIRVERDHPPTSPTPQQRAGRASNRNDEDAVGPSAPPVGELEEPALLPGAIDGLPAGPTEEQEEDEASHELPHAEPESEASALVAPAPAAAAAAAGTAGGQPAGDAEQGGAEQQCFSSVLPQVAAAAAPQAPPLSPLNVLVPRTMTSIDEDAESDFSFTTNRPMVRPPKTTSVRARARTVRMILKRWYVPRDNTSCCHYHTVIESLDEAIDYLHQDKCEPLFSPFREQCMRCACMNHGAKCVVCGYTAELQ